MAGQDLHDPFDDPCEECLQFLSGGSGYGLKDRPAVREAIDPIKYQTMQVNIKIRGRPKALDKGNGACLGLGMNCQLF